jgi:hypothetical protein
VIANMYLAHVASCLLKTPAALALLSIILDMLGLNMEERDQIRVFWSNYVQPKIGKHPLCRYDFSSDDLSLTLDAECLLSF